jgi:hypothetical protein
MAEVQTDGKLPVIGTAVTAWGDAFRAVSAMPTTAGIMFVILLIVSGLTTLMVPDTTNAAAVAGNSAFYQLISIAIGIVQSFLMAPLAIATHRYVLLGEVAQGYAIEPSNPRYMRFVGLSVLISLMFSLPNFIGSLLPGYGTAEDITTAWGFVSFIVVIIAMVVAVRRAILFPAIAVDAPAATWKNARNDTKGHSWRVAFVFFCVLVPLMAITIPLTFTLLVPARLGEPGRIAYVVISAAVHTVSLCAFAAVASHLFKAYASRLLNGVDGAATPSPATVS